MKAAVLHGPGDLRLENVSDPHPGEGEVLIRVTMNGLCGTDVTEYVKGPMMVPLYSAHPNSGHEGPTVLGHEFIGIVEAAGAGAEHLLGKRVACGAGVACGACDMCSAGRTNLCDHYYTLGLSIHGGLAERVVSPANICFVIPDECPDIEAVLAQPLAVGFHSVHRAGIRPGDSVALLGFGAIGAFVGAALENHQGRVVAFDIDQDRLNLAGAVGVKETHLLTHQEDDDQLRAVFASGFDVVFDTSGVRGAIARAIKLTRTGGTVVMVGLNKQGEELVLADAVLREIKMTTTVAHVACSDMPAALELLSRKPLSRLLVDKVVGLDRIGVEAFEYLTSGKAKGKVIVDCSQSTSSGEEYSAVLAQSG